MKPLLVLDMDGCLIGSVGKEPIPRPGLYEFLKFAFEYFDVAIWTAANEQWFNTVRTRIFDSILFELGQNFVFVRHKDHTLWDNYKSIKPLIQVWDMYISYNEDNTLMVDDIEYNFRHNTKNGILIPAYDNHYFQPDDNEMFHLKNLLSELLDYYNSNLYFPNGPHVLRRSSEPAKVTFESMQAFVDTFKQRINSGYSFSK